MTEEESDADMEGFEFEPVPQPTTEIVPGAQPILSVPSEFDRREGAMRSEAMVILRHADDLLAAEVETIEQRDELIIAGRLLQAEVKSVQEFYKPIKQQIDQFKQPFLESEKTITEMLKTAKERLGSAIQKFEEAEAKADAQRLAELQAQTPEVEGELPAPLIIQSVVPAKTRGKVERTTWRAEVTDFAKLFQAVVAGQVLTIALMPNQVYLDKRADSDREAFSIAGVEARKTEKVHFRV